MKRGYLLIKSKEITKFKHVQLQWLAGKLDLCKVGGLKKILAWTFLLFLKIKAKLKF